MEEAGDDIRNLDSDGVISFNYEDTTGKFRELLEDFGVLQDFTGKVGDAVDRAIDQPFYKDMDAFATAMRDLSIENYTTKNTIGATKVKVTYTGGYGADAYKTTERKKDTINMIDVLNGNNFFAAKMKAGYDRFKQEHPDEKFSFEDYQHAALNTRAFQYESIEDNQKKKEFWRDIIIGIGLIVGTVAAAIVCPPAAPAIIALGATYGTLELGSAVSGKDWMTGRELDTGERWLRGAFSLLDIVPGVKGVHAFSKAARGVPEAILKVAKQNAANLKTAVKESKQSVQAIVNAAAEKAAGRVRAVKESARESARIALKRAEPGMIKTAQKADELLTSVKNMKLPGRELVPAEGVVTGAKNTHSVENSVQKIIQKAEGKLSPPRRVGKPSKEEFERALDKAMEEAADNLPPYTRKPLEPKKFKKKVENDDGTVTYTLDKGGKEIKVTYDQNSNPIFNSKYDTDLPKKLYLAGDTEQFSYCSRDLYEKAMKDPKLRKQFTEEELELFKKGEKPEKYTWHHHQDAGKMQLVDYTEHLASHTGGRAYWGGGNNARNGKMKKEIIKKLMEKMQWE